MGGHQGRFELSEKISSLPGFDPRTVQSVASSYKDYTIPALVNIDLEPETVWVCSMTLSSWFLLGQGEHPGGAPHQSLYPTKRIK